MSVRMFECMCVWVCGRASSDRNVRCVSRSPPQVQHGNRADPTRRNREAKCADRCARTPTSLVPTHSCLQCSAARRPSKERLALRGTVVTGVGSRLIAFGFARSCVASVCCICVPALRYYILVTSLPCKRVERPRCFTCTPSRAPAAAAKAGDTKAAPFSRQVPQQQVRRGLSLLHLCTGAEVRGTSFSYDLVQQRFENARAPDQFAPYLPPERVMWSTAHSCLTRHTHPTRDAACAFTSRTDEAASPRPRVRP